MLNIWSCSKYQITLVIASYCACCFRWEEVLRIASIPAVVSEQRASQVQLL